MHLYLFLLVVVSLACGSLPPADVSVWRAVAASCGIVIAWGILCHVGARLAASQVRSEAINPLLGAEIIEQQLSAFRWLGLAVVLLCLGGFGLARCLDELPVLGDSMALQGLVLLGPGLLTMVMTWSAEHYYGVLLGYADGGAGGYATSLWRSFRGNVAWLLVPVLMLLGLSDVMHLVVADREVAGWITAALVLLFIPLGLPWMIRRLFKTSTINGTMRSWLADLIESVGLGRTRMARWDTGGTAFNAMVVGFVAPSRTLLLSDRLLDELPRSQIAMVVLHEAAHVKRRHVPVRMLAILPAWGVGTVVSHAFAPHDWAMVAGSAVGILLTMLVLRWVAYRTEHDADVQACRLASQIDGRVDDVPSTYEEACEVLAAALMRVTFDQPSCRRRTWLHPGVEDRVAEMRRHCKQPNPNNSNAAPVVNPA